VVLLGLGDGLGSGSVRVGAAAGALLAGEPGRACDDDAAGAPTAVVRAGVDLVGSAELDGDELVGRLLGDAAVLDWDGRAGTLPSGPLGAAAR
jgi:hypothetical protein